jgi:catechol 2,3-dioxygenase-like lactoylglutathione lyase family enzyme
MSTTTDTTAVKFHASLNVSDLTRSVEFYRVLFGLDPAKHRGDYAKFELDEPPLVLSLIPGRPGAGGNLNHVGLRVCDSEELVKIQHRLEAAGIRTQREEGVECCYAKQTKFWVTDPDRALWEIYVFHEDIDEYGDDSAPDVAQVESFAKEVPRPRVTWQHQLTEPVPARIPHDDNSVHEVLLEGTANLKPNNANLDLLLAEAFRVLRPGGEVRLHGLAGDAPLPDVPVALPGPAAAVEYVPAATEPMRSLCRTGFVDVCFEKLSPKAYFEVAGVGLREILLAGRKPGHRPRAATHAAIYLGPLTQVTDDFGNTFPRGERVPLNVHDWQALKNGPVAGQFLLLPP